MLNNANTNINYFSYIKTVKLLTLVIYGEARGESIEGKIAVGNVIMNRYKIAQYKDVWWGNTIEEIILKPYQFSCFNKNNPNRFRLEYISKNFAKELSKNIILRTCYWVAEGLYHGFIPDNTKGATYYHNKKIKPKWAKDLIMTTIIGNHIFYKEP